MARLRRIPALKKVPIEEAKARQRQASFKKAKVLEKYKDYISSLAANEAGQLKIQKEQDRQGFAIRAGLKRAAQALGVNVRIRKLGDYIYFWQE